MEKQELTDDQILETLIRIFKRARNGDTETYDRLNRLLDGMESKKWTGMASPEKTDHAHLCLKHASGQARR